MSNTFSGKDQIGIVSSFSDLVNTDFKGTMNAICWERSLVEILKKLHLSFN
jgi:hypothetical protein